MSRKGFLRSNEGIYSLSPKITIVGRESCDFIIQNLTVDVQQAVIEYVENDDCFILKDLNSTHGTYVNDCRIQNASVRLGDGDVLKFGFSTGQYEFHMQNVESIESEIPSSVTSSFGTNQMIQRPSWQSNLNINPIQMTANQPVTFPIINYSQPQAFQHRHSVNNGGVVSWTQLPKTTPFKSGRPLSSSSQNRRHLTPTAPPIQTSPVYSRRGSISGPTKRSIDTRIPSNDEQRYLQLQIEIDRLKPLESEVTEKSLQIDSLVQENTELLRALNESHSYDLFSQLQNLTEELANKKREVDHLQGLFDKLSAKSYKLNSNTSNNELEQNQIRTELEICKKDLKISNGLVTSLQKDLSSRDEAMNKLNRDNQNLVHELSEKNISISMLMNKLSRLKDVQEVETDKQDRERELISLRQKVSSFETTSQEQVEKIEAFTRSLENSKQSEKTNSTIIRDLNKQLDEAKTLIADLQHSESQCRISTVDAENKYQKFRDRVLQVALSTPGFKSTDQSLKDEEIVDIMKELAKSKIEHDRRLCEKQKLLDEANKKYNNLCDSLLSFQVKINECHELLNAGHRTSTRFEEIISMSRAINVPDELVSLKATVIKNLTNDMEFVSRMEICICQVSPELENLSLSECFTRIIQLSKEAVESKSLAEGKLTDTKLSYEEQIERLKQIQKQELEVQIRDVLEKERTESDQKCQLALSEMLSQEDSKRKLLTEEFEEKIMELERNISELKENLLEKERYSVETLENLIEEREKSRDLTTQVTMLTTQLEEMTGIKTMLEQSICEQLKTVSLKCQAEVDLYKEESTQHAITIDLLNDRLRKLNEENDNLKATIVKLQEAKKPKENKTVKSGHETNYSNVENEMAVHHATIANLEKCVAALRHENVALKNKINEYEGAINGLNMDLAGAEARLSDLKGELSESQKSEIDNLNIEIKTLDDELTALRVQMAKLSGIVDRLNQELETKKIENNNLTQHLSDAKSSIIEKETKIHDIESQMNKERETLIYNINQIEQEGRISNELAAIGSQCRGERHNQIIDAQKIALCEMRHKMKVLECTKLPIDEIGELTGKLYNLYDTLDESETSYSKRERTVVANKAVSDYTNFFPKILKNANIPEATQQMVEMKRELAELRSKKALKDGAPQGMRSLTEVIALKEKNRRQLHEIIDELPKKVPIEDPSKLDAVEQKRIFMQLEFDLDLEKSKNAELQYGFDISERCYLSLLRQIGSVLDIDSSRGTISLANLSMDDQNALRQDREDLIGIIIQKLKILKERIQRKEELLLGYEQDLVKLKQAEDLATKTQSQLENIFQQMRYKGEEVELLRETLNRTKDLLHEEKRTNTAIKKNKHYVPEKSSTEITQVSSSPKYHCPPADLLAKEKLIEKQKLEKKKRKDYELKSLKAELYKKEKELSQANNRLYTLETSRGNIEEEPVLESYRSQTDPV